MIIICGIGRFFDAISAYVSVFFLTSFILGFWSRAICKFRIADSRFTLFAWSVFFFIALSINVLAFKSMLLGILIRVGVIIFSGEDKVLRFFSFGVAGA